MEKDYLKKELIKRYRVRLNETMESLASANRDINEAPGAMQSGSDTTKYQMTSVANDLTRIAETLSGSIISIEGLKKNTLDIIIRAGSIVTIRRDDKPSVDLYFILPNEAVGGEKIEIDGKFYFCINLQSPLGLSLLNKIKGDNVEIKTGNETSILHIISVE